MHTTGLPAKRAAAHGRTRRPSPTTLGDERAYLYGVIRTIGAGPDLHSILSGVVRLATEATNCHACLIWFRQGDRLTLQASSEPYAALAGSISVAMGEGLVGWVARSRRPAFIEERALEDPRVRYFPELDEEQFQSLVSVPMFGRDGDVMGVISLHAEAPHEFARSDLDFLEHTASLMAGAVDNARLYEESTARVDVLTDLSKLSRRITAADGIDEVLEAVSAGTRALLRASTCEIYLADDDGGLRLVVADPPRTPDREVPLISGLKGIRAATGDVDLLAEALWGSMPAETPLFEALTVGEDVLGLLAVATASPPPGAGIALTAVAAHTAVAIRQHELVERLLEKNLVAEFFSALSRGDAGQARAGALAARLGVDLDAPHAVISMSPWHDGDAEARPSASTWGDASARLESALASRVPGALFERAERTLRVLAPAAKPDALRADVERTAAACDVPLRVGLSDRCTGIGSFPEAFAEAAHAAEIGSLLRRGPGVATFTELGAYRYMLAPADLARDRDRLRLQHLVEYDDRRGSSLLDTLERFLDERGNVVGTARAMYIHPNTLRQRLERIERESGIDLEHDDWLSLAIAVKIVKLGLLRRGSPAPAGPTDSGRI